MREGAPFAASARGVILRLCVFCGSNPGHAPAYRSLAARLGQTLARRGIVLVYGGGRVGLIGALADAALDAGGEVIGVMPQALVDREIGHRGLTELRIVGSMHERKALMAELADGFVALPGDRFFVPLVGFLDHLVATGFVSPVHRGMLLTAASPDELLSGFASYQAPRVGKWVEPSQS
jgi:predicted Rossmann-fold nucleotide-binding protein